MVVLFEVIVNNKLLDLFILTGGFRGVYYCWALRSNWLLPLLLGKWENSIRQRDGFFVEQPGKHLLQWDEGRWYIHGRIPLRRRCRIFHRKRRPLWDEPKTEKLEWATVMYSQDTITITSMAPINHVINPETANLQFIQQWNIERQQEGEIDQLVDAIQMDKWW